MNLFDGRSDIFFDENLGKTFGKHSQLKIIGWFDKSGYNKIYVLECSICKKDFELYGKGLFYARLSNLNKGNIPCGCSEHRKWNEDQTAILCLRKCKELDQEFLGLVLPYNGNKTKVIMSCKQHGSWQTTNVASLLSNSTRCPKCSDFERASKFIKTEDEMRLEILSWGLYSEGTTFKRSDKLDKNNQKVFIEVYCPQCNTTYLTRKGTLKRGQKACACGVYAKRWSYIATIQDGDLFLGIKFGITNNYKQRVITQNKRAAYDVNLFGVWEYEDYKKCLSAERQCKLNVPCQIFSKEEMPDGYTETTYIKYLDEVIKIYETNEGKRLF